MHQNQHRHGIFSGAIFVSALVLFTCTVCKNAFAVRGIRERDYMTEQSIQSEGSTPVIGQKFTLSTNSRDWPEQITISMKKTKSFLVKIEPIQGPAWIIVSASQPSTPRLTKAVWVQNDLRYPVVFWTHEYFIPESNCSYLGCPRIRFSVKSGAVRVSIIEIQKNKKAFLD